MLLALGDPDQAELPLRQAALEMQDFEADGEFRALVGRESTKSWKGEPYEKMAAFLMLGAVLQQSGDQGNARAMYKSAVLADAGTVEERYRSDFVAPLVLQALSYDSQQKTGQAERAYQRATDALYSQVTIARLSEILSALYADSEADQLARTLLLQGLAAGGTAFPRDPVRAARGALSQAMDLYRLERDRRPRDRHPDVRGVLEETWDEVPVALDVLGGQLIEDAAALNPQTWTGIEAQAARLEELHRNPPSAVLLIEAGEGPHKAREGSYGQLMVIREGTPARAPDVRVGDREVELFPLDSYTYQATTRGGRRVDAYLQGKAVYKDASYVTGWVLWEVADVLAQGRETAQAIAGVLYITGCVLMVSSVATMPQADIREWGMLPEQLYLAPLWLSPGQHTVMVRGEPVAVDVPQDGQAFRLVVRPAG